MRLYDSNIPSGNAYKVHLLLRQLGIDIALYGYSQSAEAVGYRIAQSVRMWLERVSEQPGYVRIKRDPTGKCPL